MESRLHSLALDVTHSGPDDVAFDGLRVLQHPDRMHKFLTGRELDIVPVMVQLWPSLSCDVRCPTCPYRLTDARDRADADAELHIMSVNHFRKIIASLEKAGVKSVFLTGGGEPLVHPSIREMVSILGASKLGWGLFTNGTSLTPSLANAILTANPGFFRVSLDAGSPRLYRKIYGVSEGMFDTVVHNIATTGKIAKQHGFNWFGAGFALLPNVSDADIVDIRRLLVRLFEETALGVNFASFRPRVVHFKGTTPVAPQKYAGQYQELASRIRALVTIPIHEKYGTAVRIDHKFGVFTDCDRPSTPIGGWGASWTTTLDHLGRGSSISHLTGSSGNPSAWATSGDWENFSDVWTSSERRAIHRSIVAGDLKLPIANGFRSIDAFLEKVKLLFPTPLSPSEATEELADVESWVFHRSSRPIFVG